jgi:hypothetical protein
MTFLAFIGILTIFGIPIMFVCWLFSGMPEYNQGKSFYLHNLYKDCPACGSKPEHQKYKVKMTTQEATRHILSGDYKRR